MAEKTEIQKRAIWWSGKKRQQIYNLLTEGKTIQEISETLNCRADSIHSIISNPYFLKKLQDFLSRVLFNYQVNKIQALDEVFKLYWDIIVGKAAVEGLTKDQASKHFVKILSLKAQESKIINPKQYNLIMNLFRADSPEKAMELAKDFGFKKLEVPEGEGPQQNERPKSHPQLDKGEQDKDK